ncbi:hypothetical protein [Photobacterium leiognathi]|uniref:hypothetical protein n=1 Tax=Photobacterium leiognathi TaxID=553611 RepID=UPI0027383EA4|nr:hypothetical protein [Photobacterium leiognathi]
MGGVSVWQLLIILTIFVIGILPWVMALLSKNVKGKDKVLWFLVSFFFSWIGYVSFKFLVVNKRKVA